MNALFDPPATLLYDPLAAPPKSARLAVASLFFLNGALFATWVSRIPAIESARGMSHGALGLALFAMAAGALLAMPAAGAGASRFGSHRVCQGAAFLYCIALPMLALSPNVALLTIALFCFGAAHGATDVAMNAQAVAVEALYRRPIMSSLHALFSLGGLAGAGIGGFVAAMRITPPLHFLAVSILLGGTTAALAFPRLLDSRATESLHSSANAAAREPRFVLPSRALLALGVIAFCTMVGEGAMADWTGVFLREVTRSNEALAAAGYAAFSIAMAAGRFSGDSLALRLGPVKIVRFGGMIAATGLGIALLLGHPLPALIGFAAVGLGFAAVVPQVFSAAGVMPDTRPGAAVATVTSLGYLGFLIGPPLIGFAAEFLGLRLALGLIVATSALLILLAPRVRRKEERLGALPISRTSLPPLALDTRFMEEAG